MKRRGFFGSLLAVCPALSALGLGKAKPPPEITKRTIDFGPWLAGVSTGAIPLDRVGIVDPGPELRREMVKFADAQKRFLVGRPIRATQDEQQWDYLPGDSKEF